MKSSRMFRTIKAFAYLSAMRRQEKPPDEVHQKDNINLIITLLLEKEYIYIYVCVVCV